MTDPRRPVESVGGVPAEHGDRCDAGVHAAVSWTYVGGERAQESLLRIRHALKEPRGWWNGNDAMDYQKALGELDEPVPVRRPWWDRLLCAMGLHHWSHPGGSCESCGARDDFFDPKPPTPSEAGPDRVDRGVRRL